MDNDLNILSLHFQADKLSAWTNGFIRISRMDIGSRESLERLMKDLLKFLFPSLPNQVISIYHYWGLVRRNEQSDGLKNVKKASERKSINSSLVYPLVVIDLYLMVSLF